MPTLILDTTVLSCFARSGNLEILRSLASEHTVVTTPSVIEELRRGSGDHPSLRDACALPWLEVVRLETIEELTLFGVYANRLVAGDRNHGEAEVLAKAEVSGSTPVTDDQVAVQCARSRGLVPKRTLALIARGVRRGLLTQEDAVALVDDLIEGGARFPCRGRRFLGWATENGLLSEEKKSE